MIAESYDSFQLPQHNLGFSYFSDEYTTTYIYKFSIV